MKQNLLKKIVAITIAMTMVFALVITATPNKSIAAPEYNIDSNTYTVKLHYDDNIMLKYQHKQDIDDWWIGNGDVPLGGALDSSGTKVVNQLYCVDAAVPFHSYATGSKNKSNGGTSKTEGGYLTDTVPGYVSASPDQVPMNVKSNWAALSWIVNNGYSDDASVTAINNMFPDLSDFIGGIGKNAGHPIPADVAVMATKAAVWHFTNPDVAFLSSSFLEKSGGNVTTVNGIKQRQFIALMGALVNGATQYTENPGSTTLPKIDLEVKRGPGFDPAGDTATKPGNTIYGPYVVDENTNYLTASDKVFLSIEGATSDKAAIGLLKSDKSTPISPEHIYASEFEGPAVKVGEEFYLNVPDGYSLDKLTLDAFTRGLVPKPASAPGTPLVLVYQDTKGTQYWNEVQAFIGKSHQTKVVQYGDAKLPLKDERGTIRVIKTVKVGGYPGSEYIFQLLDNYGRQVDLGNKNIPNANVVDADHGLFSVPINTENNSGSVTIGDLPYGKYTVTEIASSRKGYDVECLVTGATDIDNGISYGATFALEDNNLPEVSVLFQNTKKAPTLIINKECAVNTNDRLKGAEFKLTNPSGYDSGIVKTNELGRYQFDNTPYYPTYEGNWYLEEVTAPDGYDKLKGPITLKVDRTGCITEAIPSPEDKDLVAAVDLDTYQVNLIVKNNKTKKPTDKDVKPKEPTPKKPSTIKSKPGKKTEVDTEVIETRDKFDMATLIGLFAISGGVLLIGLRKKQIKSK